MDERQDINIGGATAYAYARSKGYTGTEAEFAQLMANIGNTQQEIEAAIDEFINTTAPGAVQAVETAQTSALDAIGASKTDALDAINTSKGSAVAAVNSAGDTQKAAVDAEGQRVIDSIPADYTELTGEVDDLKSAVFENVVFTTSPGYYTTGGTISSAGEATQEVYTSKINVREGDKIHFSLVMPNSRELWAAAGQFDVVDAWVSRNTYGAVIASSIEWDYTVPSGVRKVSFTYRTYGVASVSISIDRISAMYSRNEIDSIVGQIENDVNTVDTDLDGLIPLPPFENGVVYASNGDLAYATRAWSVRPVKGTGIALKAGDIIRNNNHSSYEMLGAYTTDGVTYTGISSTSSPYIAPATGTYYITLQLKAGAGTISDIPGFLANFHFFRPSSRNSYGRPRSTFDAFSIKSVNHRGYSTTYPENTIPAFIKSAEQGFKIVETDLRFTSDSVPVLLHDASINRTARNADGTAVGSTVNIADITYEQALAYDFGVWKGEEFAGTKIPSLEEAVTAWKKLGLFAYVELEFGSTGDQMKTAIDTIKKLDYLDHITFISYQIPLMADVICREQSCRLGYIVESVNATAISDLQKIKSKYNDVFIDADYLNITSETLALAKNAGETVEVWTIDSTSVLDGLDLYISGVTSNQLNAQDYYNQKLIDSL